ncbi:hypothetical protein GCM10023318_29460 [Nocardia callitridis]|uniref:Uncharacterized protein n=1 Tax=Nocardia callitridis TaxID=648753 RepID=A0ABP9KCL2_9NOCA
MRARHERGARQRGDIERLRILVIHPVACAAEASKLFEVWGHGTHSASGAVRANPCIVTYVTI